MARLTASLLRTQNITRNKGKTKEITKIILTSDNSPEGEGA